MFPAVAHFLCVLFLLCVETGCCYVTSEFSGIVSSHHRTLAHVATHLSDGQNTQETVVTVNSPVIINMQRRR